MDKLKITTIQTDLVWENKTENLNRLAALIRAVPEKTHLFVLPEMFSTGFSMQPERLAETMEGETVAWMRNLAKERGAILAGSLIISEGGEYYNRLVWMLPNGTTGHYDKRHCFTLAGEDKHYAAGSKRVIASVGGWKINLQICYDLRFPVWARQQIVAEPDAEATPEYDVLLYVANWPAKRIHAWKTLLQARAIENQCYVVGVNRIGEDQNGLYHSGDSMVVDPLGEILYQKADAADVHTVTLEREKLNLIREKLPFWRDADDFQVF
jgi:predicted amidohydrolase